MSLEGKRLKTVKKECSIEGAVSPWLQFEFNFIDNSTVGGSCTHVWHVRFEGYDSCSRGYLVVCPRNGVSSRLLFPSRGGGQDKRQVMDPMKAQQLAAELEVEMMADMYNR